MPGRRVAVLGEMLELGDGAAAGHERVGVAAAAVAELLVVVGAGAAGIARGAREAGLAAERIVEVGDRAAALAALEERLQPGDVVLVKASRGIELDLLVDALVESRGRGVGDRRAHPGPAARVRDRRDPHAAVHPAAADDGLHEADPRWRAPTATRSSTGRRRWAALLLIVVVVALFLLLRGVPEAGINAPLAALAGVGLLGAFDDYLNAKTGEGIRVRQKLIWQVVFAVAAAFLIQRVYAIDQIAVPFLGPVFVDPAIYVTFAAFAIVAASNGVNITDGLDGLAGGTLVFAFVAFLLVALLNRSARPAEPRVPLRADHRGAARLPVVQRPSGPDLHGRFRVAVARGDARGHRPDHRPDPRPAADRPDLRHRDRRRSSSRSPTSR